MYTDIKLNYGHFETSIVPYREKLQLMLAFPLCHNLCNNRL